MEHLQRPEDFGPTQRSSLRALKLFINRLRHPLGGHLIDPGAEQVSNVYPYGYYVGPVDPGMDLVREQLEHRYGTQSQS